MIQLEPLWIYQQADLALDRFENGLKKSPTRTKLFNVRNAVMEQQNRIKRLEAELHCVLFFRSSQGVRLTPEGEKLYAHIAVAFESIEAGEEELLSDQSLAGGSIHIAASGLALQGCLLRVLSRYRRQYPHVHIYLTNNSTPQGLSAVQNGLADFAVVSVRIRLKNSGSVKFKRSRSAGPSFPR